MLEAHCQWAVRPTAFCRFFKSSLMLANKNKWSFQSFIVHFHSAKNLFDYTSRLTYSGILVRLCPTWTFRCRVLCFVSFTQFSRFYAPSCLVKTPQKLAVVTTLSTKFTFKHHIRLERHSQTLKLPLQTVLNEHVWQCRFYFITKLYSVI